MDPLRSDDARAMIGYLADIFGKLNCLNCALRAKKTLVDAKTNVFGFVAKLELWRNEVARRDFTSFTRLLQCVSVSDSVLAMMSDHMRTMIGDFQSRFEDLEEIDFPDGLTQPLLCSLHGVDRPLQHEMADLQNDGSAQVIHKSKGQLMWLNEEIEKKYHFSVTFPALPHIISC